MAAFSTM